MADCTAGHDKCVRKNPVGSPGRGPAWQEIKEVKIGGAQQNFVKKTRTRITGCAGVKDHWNDAWQGPYVNY